MKARVNLRERNPHSGSALKPESLQLQGRVFEFTYGWQIEGHEAYPGEVAYIPIRGQDYPEDAPVWIASGDLEVL